jgi:hypothetical protein
MDRGLIFTWLSSSLRVEKDCLATLWDLLSEKWDHLLSFWFGIRWRSTSKPIDKCTCVGVLLDLDMNVILKQPGGERMKTLLTLPKRFPADMIFAGFTHMRDEGFGLAPTFMSRSVLLQASISGGKNGAIVTLNGLFAEWPGVLLSSDSRHIAVTPGIEYETYVFPVPDVYGIEWPSFENQTVTLYGFTLYFRDLQIDDDWRQVIGLLYSRQL